MSKNNFEKIKGAGVGGRLGAMILDMLIIYIIYGAVVLLIGLVTGFEDMIAAFLYMDYGSVYMPFKLAMVAFPITWCVYSIISEGGKKEATLGKRAVNLRVVHTSGKRAKGFDIVVRNIAKVFPALLSSLFFDNYGITIIVGVLNTVYFLVPLCNKNHRAIHDFLSGTVVAKTEVVEKSRNKIIVNPSVPELNITLPSVEEIKAMRETENNELVEHTEMVEMVEDNDRTQVSFSSDTSIDPVVGWLVCLTGSQKGRDFKIHSDNNYIGSSQKMDICIQGDEAISRENHATIAYDSKYRMFYFAPGESRSIVRINGKAVLMTAELKANDKVEIGNTELLFIPMCGEKFDWMELK